MHELVKHQSDFQIPQLVSDSDQSPAKITVFVIAFYFRALYDCHALRKYNRRKHRKLSNNQIVKTGFELFMQCLHAVVQAVMNFANIV